MRTLLKLSALVLGVMAVAAPEPKVEMTVQLPPFIIDRPTGPRWRYLQIPRFEILSRCNDLKTEQLALAFHRANQLLGMVLPERFQITFDAPQQVIFYDQKLWPAAEQAAVATMLQERTLIGVAGLQTPAPAVPSGSGVAANSGAAAGRPGGRFFTNQMLSDADSITTFVLVSESSVDPSASYLTPAYVRNLLQGRVPALPTWFITGFMQLYGRMDFEEQSVSVRTGRWPHGTGVLTGAGAVVADPRFLPWAEFLEDRAPTADDLTRWRDQGELFVAWGLDPASGRAAGFWKLMELAGAGPITPEIFRACFGFEETELTSRLTAYVSEVHTLRWTLPDAAARLPGELEDASTRQVARIKGEWERLEARYVRANQPELESHYVELARRTLRKAYDRDDRDPRLLASLGLLESEAGDKAAALSYLEQAMQGGVVRPRAAFELARLRYDRLVGRSTRNDGKYPAEQIGAVVQPLLAGMKQSPPLAAAYELLAHVSALSVEPAPPEVLAALAEGARLFPAKRDRLLELATKQD